MSAAAPRLSLVVPTLNEAEGIESFLRTLLAVTDRMGGVEVLVMDDRSGDGTAELAGAVLGKSERTRGEVVVREGPPGLGRSVVEGWQKAQGEVLGVIDADLSHPPSLLPDLLAEIDGGADVAVATRYMPGGGTEGWPLERRVASRFAGGLARALLVGARDPLSGYLVLRREVIDGVELDPTGWKIGLEVLVRGRWSVLGEVPFVFRDRAAGQSKFGAGAVRDFLHHLARLRVDMTRAGRLRR